MTAVELQRMVGQMTYREACMTYRVITEADHKDAEALLAAKMINVKMKEAHASG
jgi:hypothetical protein